MVEFALLSPILVLLVLGLVDLSRAVYEYNVISNGAREGAREAVLAYNQCRNNDNTACGLTPPAASSLVGVDQAVRRAGPGVFSSICPPTCFKTDAAASSGSAPTCVLSGNQSCIWVFVVNGTTTNSCSPPNPPPSGTDPTSIPCDFNANKEGGGHNVVVEVEYKFTPLTPLAAQALGQATTMWAKSEMKTEY